MAHVASQFYIGQASHSQLVQSQDFAQQCHPSCPCVFTYSSIIDAFCKQGNVEAAAALQGQMVKKGLAFNVVT